jgi:cytosolic phospholipase A2
MLNTIGSLSGAQEAGILGCITYIAGVSGSCWSLGVIYSGVAGSCNPLDAGRHVKDRIQFGYLDKRTLEALIVPPTNKVFLLLYVSLYSSTILALQYLLSGLLRKAAGPSGSVSLVDIYGTLIASRIFVPSEIRSLNPRHLSLHSFRGNIDNGAMPLPIFTALQRGEYCQPPNVCFIDMCRQLSSPCTNMLFQRFSRLRHRI